ncbi:hypothetical protein FHR87_002735 [Azomonas macrocytogenes]|uniref:Uncharacterized protein n=1 Tax=Azomonas macrocytogenes TaxID=69962 RepID=A0A839T657_AZOMA|nr:hypothetical protein [Azomonas macrocytogenes]
MIEDTLIRNLIEPQQLRPPDGLSTPFAQTACSVKPAV